MKKSNVKKVVTIAAILAMCLNIITDILSGVLTQKYNFHYLFTSVHKYGKI